ncbi:MAG TPA: hypothetical protein VM115_10145 [Vicinamibacterales bacterium]|nr:hypothetical protein [Vicinamibacterales bacterium]
MKRTLFSVALIGVGVVALGGFENGDGVPQPPAKEWAVRNEQLARARVLRSEPFNAAAIDFAADPNKGVVDATLTICKYKPDEVSGTTPKFDCELPSGEKLKVKYGGSKEIPSETAATRLLHALGFGADRVSRVDTVRCYGCPFQPFHTRALLEMLNVAAYFDKRIDYSSHRDFTKVGVERNFDGEAIEVGPERGWAFYELGKIDPSRGGATRDEVDALRLMAIFLHHWDNKSSNQRLTCPDAKTAHCQHPLAMIQDVGSEFGPKKADLDEWKSRPVWLDAAACTVSMKGMPYNGGTFEDVTISEGGRKLLADRLRQVPAKQVQTLFTAGGFEDVPAWTAAFHDRVKQIVERPACPVTAPTKSAS